MGAWKRPKRGQKNCHGVADLAHIKQMKMKPIKRFEPTVI